MSLEDDPRFLDAVIVRYASGKGTLLCRRESDANLQETVDAYEKKPSSDTNWFVSFNWNSLSLKSRLQMQEQQSLGKFDGLFIGYVVRCVVVGAPNWKAEGVLIDFQSKFQINAIKKCPKGGAKKRSTPKAKKPKRFKMTSLSQIFRFRKARVRFLS